MLFIVSLNFTDQGIRNIKDSPKRAQAARELAKKLDVEIKHLSDIRRIRSRRLGRNGERRQHGQVRTGDRQSGKCAHAHGPRVDRGRVQETCFRTAVARRATDRTTLALSIRGDDDACSLFGLPLLFRAC